MVWFDYIWPCVQRGETETILRIFFPLVISNYSCELLREKECNGLLDPDLALCSAFSLVFFAREGGGF
jgi:hypothetical protein